MHSYETVYDTFIRTKQHQQRKKEKHKTAIYSLAYIAYALNKWYTKSTAKHCDYIMLQR